ncbi:MAG: hypothetical protein WBJ48_10215 [Bacteroidales bacterium]|jgi:hypothetical protein
MKKHEPPTKCICHKGFGGYSSIVARSNFRVGGQVTTTQSLTAHTLERWAACKKDTTNMNDYE